LPSNNGSCRSYRTMVAVASRFGMSRQSMHLWPRRYVDTPPPCPSRPSSPSDLGFVRRPMVHWPDPHQLVDTAVRVWFQASSVPMPTIGSCRLWSQLRSRTFPGKPVCGWTRWPILAHKCR
jgi:hypothetical protein